MLWLKLCAKVSVIKMMFLLLLRILSAMIDLAKLLAIDGMDLPRQKISFQFDNCSENKVV
jgi:hypothetical protein